MNDQRHTLPKPSVCAAPDCDGVALLFSDPPRCMEHMVHPDEWFRSAMSALSALDIADAVAFYRLHDSYRITVVEGNDAGRKLYKDFKHRRDPEGRTAFSFSDIVYFALAAAVSGIIGNFAYDVVKRLVQKLSETNNRRELIETLEHAVFSTTYENVRIEQHGNTSPVEEGTSELETEIHTRFRLIVVEKEKFAEE